MSTSEDIKSVINPKDSVSKHDSFFHPNTKGGLFDDWRIYLLGVLFILYIIYYALYLNGVRVSNNASEFYYKDMYCMSVLSPNYDFVRWCLAKYPLICAFIGLSAPIFLVIDHIIMIIIWLYQNFYVFYVLVGGFIITCIPDAMRRYDAMNE